MARPLRFQSWLLPAAGLVLLVGVGAVGYRLIEGWSWLDGIYMSVITLATVGFGEIHPLSPAGRVFTIALIVVGLAAATYFISTLGRTLFEDTFGPLLWRRRVQKQIEKLDGHYILCGCGRVGRLVHSEFQATGAQHVILEHDPAVVQRLIEEGALVLEGDATSEELLQGAGIKRARGLVATLPDDAANVYIALVARDLNQTMPIITRASDEGVEKRMLKAGATRVISPNRLGGRMMAQALLAPEVLDFLSLATARENVTLQIEQVSVAPSSRLADEQVVVGQMRERFNVSVVALRTQEGTMFDMPGHDRSIAAGDTLIVVGRGPDCASLARLALAP